ncbi:Prion-like-(Q/N-rich)-domain-bearing protein [Caenorhabditis elegans]|uniref:Prion-like-(Q/N-rich)-domain-bearing protein n=1 Tax=Caenorhabditis elegans TaxID=6239 RepID=U4PBP8_CAEEL|nr:Prion-like-(Q/N-rich)-domain-bearing protein [Caenorhabditis elegans]CDH93148.1 Prion-like-(Q/N-rich)-domain-bearing protein [Caenorhabditis elegans]|eukprot:NP_001294405.1 Prion-like-(Q/N-rich)-domain-bearing protein [Caenorhabditis elegans]
MEIIHLSETYSLKFRSFNVACKLSGNPRKETFLKHLLEVFHRPIIDNLTLSSKKCDLQWINSTFQGLKIRRKQNSVAITSTT